MSLTSALPHFRNVKCLLVNQSMTFFSFFSCLLGIFCSYSCQHSPCKLSFSFRSNNLLFAPWKIPLSSESTALRTIAAIKPYRPPD